MTNRMRHSWPETDAKPIRLVRDQGWLHGLTVMRYMWWNEWNDSVMASLIAFSASSFMALCWFWLLPESIRPTTTRLGGDRIRLLSPLYSNPVCNGGGTPGELNIQKMLWGDAGWHCLQYKNFCWVLSDEDHANGPEWTKWGSTGTECLCGHIMSTNFRCDEWMSRNGGRETSIESLTGCNVITLQFCFVLKFPCRARSTLKGSQI